MTTSRPSTGKAPKKPAQKSAQKPARKQPVRSCPICGKPADTVHMPFCSRRCADLDLGLWLKGAYRIPAVEPPDSLTDDGASGAGTGPGHGGGNDPGDDG